MRKTRVLLEGDKPIVILKTPKTRLNINLGSQNLHSIENSLDPTFPANMVFLQAVGANRLGVVSPLWKYAL